MTDTTETGTNEAPSEQMFSNTEVQKMIQERTAKERENSRVKAEEVAQLRKQVEELSAKMEKGTATTEEMTQLQTANKAAEQGQMQGIRPEELPHYVEAAMLQKKFEDQLITAHEKDPEFAKLVEANKKTNAVSIEHINGMAYLPNPVAVLKHIMKDKKSLDLYNAAIANVPRDGGVAAMTVLNNFSDRLSNTTETPHPSDYEPAARLPDAADDSQNFDLTDYINSKY